MANGAGHMSIDKTLIRDILRRLEGIEEHQKEIKDQQTKMQVDIAKIKTRLDIADKNFAKGMALAGLVATLVSLAMRLAGF